MADFELELRQAREFERAGRLDEAMAAYRRASAADPRAAEPRIRIVGLHLMAGRTTEAERDAREFVAATDVADAHAMLGQVLRLTARPADAVASFTLACSRRPEIIEYRRFLHEAMRTLYWSPDADRYALLRTRVTDGSATPAERYRYLHACLVGLLSPEVQRWLVAGGEELLPSSLLKTLDGRFDGRFSKELDAIFGLAESLRGSGPYVAASARVTTASAQVEGTLIDSDTTILGALEMIDRGAYAIHPFGDLRRIEIRSRGPWFSAAVTWKDGAERIVDIPALYLFTDGCRDPRLREGSLTVWRGLRDRFRIGLGLRDFYLAAGGKPRLIGFDDIRAIEFR